MIRASHFRLPMKLTTGQRAARPMTMVDARTAPAKSARSQAPQPVAAGEVPHEAGRQWQALGVSIVVHGFLLAILAIVMVGGRTTADSTQETLVQLRDEIGNPGQGVGESVSFDLGPLMPTPQRANLDVVASLSVARLPAAASNIGGIDGIEGGGAGGIGIGGPGHGGSGGGSGTGFLNLPRNSVQAGSFAAWTTPQGVDNVARRFKPPGDPGDSPQPGELYHITIQIKLPPNRKTYSLSDLSGEVIGTDKYRQKIPQGVYIVGPDKKLVKPPRTGKIDVKKNVVEIIVVVPGAARLVEDTIHVESQLLKESQTLTLKFDG